MKDIEKIKAELQAFVEKYNACEYNAREKGLEAIKGDSLTELFANICKYIHWYKDSNKKAIEFNSIFDNELIIEDGTLLCCCSNLDSIEIPNSVHTIGESAFRYCRKLTEIEIPNSVTSICEDAFRDCEELTWVIIPNSVTSIGNSAFQYCSGLTSIRIPNSVTSIGDYAFYNCSELTSITVPKSVISIGQYAFKNYNPNLKIIRK